MSDTPETQEAVERWRQGKINIFDEMARLERERNQLKSDLWAERTEHGWTKKTLSALAAERNQLRAALAQVAEDCTAWLHSESDEPSVEFVKAIRQYAHEQSQAPLAPSS